MIWRAVISAVVFLFKASVLSVACVPGLGCATELIIHCVCWDNLAKDMLANHRTPEHRFVYIFKMSIIDFPQIQFCWKVNYCKGKHFVSNSYFGHF